MGLFDKKFCDICGEKIGLLGNRKLEDGNLCKNCAAKLSPWFTGRRHSDLASIRSQLASREENQQRANAFHMTRFFGNGNKLLMVDEGNRTFAVAPRSAMPSGNPDIIDISAITSYNMEPEESKREIYYKDSTGANKSYEPRRYEYSYDFYYEIHVNHPYIEEIRFQLNDKPVEMRNPATTSQPNGFFGAVAAGLNKATGASNPQYDVYMNVGNDITNFLNMLRNGNTASAPNMNGMNSMNSMNGMNNDMNMSPAMMQADMVRRQAELMRAVSSNDPNAIAAAQANLQAANAANASMAAGAGMAQPVAAPMGMQGAGMAQPVAAAWFCEACGTKNDGGSFCQGCGMKKG